MTAGVLEQTFIDGVFQCVETRQPVAALWKSVKAAEQWAGLDAGLLCADWRMCPEG